MRTRTLNVKRHAPPMPSVERLARAQPRASRRGTSRELPPLGRADLLAAATSAALGRGAEVDVVEASAALLASLREELPPQKQTTGTSRIPFASARSSSNRELKARTARPLHLRTGRKKQQARSAFESGARGVLRPQGCFPPVRAGGNGHGSGCQRMATYVPAKLP